MFVPPDSLQGRYKVSSHSDRLLLTSGRGLRIKHWQSPVFGKSFCALAISKSILIDLSGFVPLINFTESFKARCSLIEYFCENKGSLLGRREFLCQKANQNSYSWTVTKTHKLRDASRYSNDSINLAQCWRDFCRDCSFFSWNQDKKECNVSNEKTEVCKTQRGSECSQIIEEIPDFTTVRANNCMEKNMTDDSGQNLCFFTAQRPLECESWV